MSLWEKRWFWQFLMFLPSLVWSQAVISIDPPSSELPQIGQTLTVQVKVDKAEEVIGFDHKPEGGLIPVRRGWYCPSCHAWEIAILRETKVENNE